MRIPRSRISCVVLFLVLIQDSVLASEDEYTLCCDKTQLNDLDADYWNTQEDFDSRAIDKHLFGGVCVDNVTYVPSWRPNFFSEGRNATLPVTLLVNFLPTNAQAILGVSFCDVKSVEECHVLEISGFVNGRLVYEWRRQSKQETGAVLWIPGRKDKLPSTRLNKEVPGKKGSWYRIGQIKHQFYVETRGNLTRIRYNDGKAVQRDMSFHIPYDDYVTAVASNKNDDSAVVERVADDFQYTTIGSRTNDSGLEVHRADTLVAGPCYNGFALGFNPPTCNQKMKPRDPVWPVNKTFDVISSKPGIAEAIIASSILEAKATRKSLCVSLHGLASHEGVSIEVTATDASGRSNVTAFLGELTYNMVNPPVWQQPRLTTPLPDCLQNVRLRINFRSKTPTPESFALLHKAKLCSFDDCGQPTAQGTPNIAYGKQANPAKYPWHVGLYLITGTDPDLKYICGGTLVRQDVVISAAHCFGEGHSSIDKTKYKLAVGKKYSSLFANEPNKQQLSDALDIQVPERYNGRASHFAEDIAIIRVNFTTTSQILPACIDWFENVMSSLQPGAIGEVAGWGATHKGDIQSKELNFAKLPYVPYYQCIKGVPQSFLPFITPDKFCAGNINGSTVKTGDSGGGVVFKAGGRWYLRGVVSVGVPETLTYSTFTDIDKALPWIRSVLNITRND